MALIDCVECRKQVSDKAKNCPNCGYPINSKSEYTNSNSEGFFLRTLNTGCNFALYAFLAIFILFILVSIFSK